MVFTLPNYLAPLPETDPAFPALNTSMHDFVLKPPGQGGLVEAQIVKFTQDRPIFRIYGGAGKASQCGFWWNLDPPTGNTSTYFMQFAVCPEWNDATNIVKCSVPKDFNAIVGPGQSATCADNSTISPDPIFLQLNGDVCQIANMLGEDLTCEWCAAEQFNLENSACADVSEEPSSGTFTLSCSAALGASFMSGMWLF